MDSKNVIAAIALSSAVIVLYSLFFVPEQIDTTQNLTEKKIEQNTDTPSLEQKETIITISRDEALKLNERVKFENDNIVGSISLKGASIDDLTFKNYKVDLNNDKKVTLLGPKILTKVTLLRVDLLQLIKILTYQILILFGQ